MMRTFLIAAALGLSLVSETLPASAYSCAEWCRAYHCNGQMQAGPARVCMNRCVAACRIIVSKRRRNAS